MAAPSPLAGLGGWAPDVTGAGPEWTSATAAQRRNAIDAAVHAVWTLSGRQFGVAEVLVAPWVSYVAPALYRPYSLNASGTYARLRTDRARRILLPGPVVAVSEVKIGDVVLVRGEDYALDHTGHLIKREGVWPAQDVNWPVFTVRYIRGTAVPPAAQVAAGLYAQEWLKARVGSQVSKLPSRTREIARAGISVSLAGPEDLAAAGLTGIKGVDDFLVAANPTKQAAQPSVWSVETSAHRILEVGPAPVVVGL